MKKNSAKRQPRTLVTADVCDALATLAPLDLAQSWDNVGLIAGDRFAKVRRVLLCIDLMPDVVTEAIRRRVQLIVAYHPPIFKPVSRLVAPDHKPTDAVFRCIAAGIGVYTTHTALDAAEGGTNDVIAAHCGMTDTQPLEYVGGRDDGESKIVVFVPSSHVDAVADAMFHAGGGGIGDYERCSFRTPGTGTFCGGESTRPAIGVAGRCETVPEIRLEVVASRSVLPFVVAALRKAHPYEEPAFDIYPLQTAPRRGIGRVGELVKPVSLVTLAKRLKRKTGAVNVDCVGSGAPTLTRAIICVGAAGSLPMRVHPGEGDVVITGEMRHHDALALLRRRAAAITLGHWASERPVLAEFRDRLVELLPKLNVVVSESDRDPFTPV